MKTYLLYHQVSNQAKVGATLHRHVLLLAKAVNNGGLTLARPVLAHWQCNTALNSQRLESFFMTGAAALR